MAHFKKKRGGSKQEVPTSAMPDVVFMLLFFFMVTTVLREVTLKVRVNLTQAENSRRSNRNDCFLMSTLVLNDCRVINLVKIKFRSTMP